MENYSIFLFVPEPWQYFSFYGDALLGMKPFSSLEGHPRQPWDEKRGGDWWGSWGQILPWATTRLWIGPKLERTWQSGPWSAQWQIVWVEGARGAGSCCHSSSHWLWTSGKLPGACAGGTLVPEVVALSFLEHRACLCTRNSLLEIVYNPGMLLSLWMKRDFQSKMGFATMLQSLFLPVHHFYKALSIKEFNVFIIL